MARFCASCSRRCFIPFILRAVESGCLKPGKRNQVPPSAVELEGEKIGAGWRPPPFSPLLAAPTAPRPLAPAPFLCREDEPSPQPRGGGRGRPPPFSRSPLPFFPSRYNDWAGTAPQPCLIGSGRPSPRRGGGRGQLGRGSPEPGLTAKRRQAGRKDYRTRGRRPGAQR